MKLTIGITLAALTLAGSVLAQEQPGGGTAPADEAMRPRQACRADVQALCAGKRGKDAMMCLRENGDKVSAPCREAIEKRRLRQEPHPRVH